MKPHRFHPEANEEYAAAAAHYAKITPELGGRFFDEIERVIAEACALRGASAKSMATSVGTPTGGLRCEVSSGLGGSEAGPDGASVRCFAACPPPRPIAG